MKTNTLVEKKRRLYFEGSKMFGYRGEFSDFVFEQNEDINYWGVFNFKDDSPIAFDVVHYIENGLNEGIELNLLDLNEF